MKKVAVIDACALMLLLDNSTTEPDRIRRREKAAGEMEKLEGSGAEIVIPAPVFAELCAGGPDGELAANALLRREGHICVQALDLDASRLAGQITANRLKTRGVTPRNVVKFDALITAIAVNCGATVILTADTDIPNCMRHVPSEQQIPVINVT